MTILQHTEERLVVRAGTRIVNETTLTLDRNRAVARVDRATFMIPRRSQEVPFSDIADVAVAGERDAGSGVERYLPVIRLASGRVIALPPFDDRAEAEYTADQMREFVGLKH